MSTTHPAPAAALPSEPKPRFWHRRYWHRYKIPHWQKSGMFHTAARWDSPVYALLVGLGVPIEAYLTTNVYAKLGIFMAFFALACFYLIIELAEMIKPVLRDSVVREMNAKAQIDSTQLLKYWGAQGAVVVWALVVIGYIASQWPDTGWWGNLVFIFWAIVWYTPVWYGPFEVIAIVHTYLMAKYSTDFLNLVLYVLLKAFPRAERIEEEAGPKRG